MCRRRPKAARRSRPAGACELARRGADVSEIADFLWGRFVWFADPDGNRWAVQQIPARD